ncbi:MAG: SH3 domain-containing protein [Prevotella sp.]|nr:SH3 domain-containing protein [Alistipes senegalensis]MCM1357319.1 SH3 domain-containing protein [Prevotella sp.]MCM1472762.1 SH3 domain-containing protein [Muribaculaceae bacterium]
MKKKKIISFISAGAISVSAIFTSTFCTYADDMVYSDFNINDVNGSITVNIPEDTTAEVKITFTSPEVTDEPYYIKAITGTTSGTMQIEGRDTTEDDYRNYTLYVSLKRNSSGDTVSYADTFNVPDVNDNPESFRELIYNFSFDDDFSGSNWTLSSETETEKNIIMHYGTSRTGDVNGDGIIDSVDSSLVLSEYSSLSTEGGTSTLNEKQKLSADVNKDGIIDAVDGSLILVYYAISSTNGNPSWENILENSGTDTTTTTITTTTTTTAETNNTTTTTTTTTTAVTPPEYSSYVEAVQLMAGKITDSMLHHEYYVYDINNDGTYELIMEMGETEEDNKYSVYSMKNGEMIFAGDIDAEYSYLASDGETLYKVAGQNQIEYVEKISFNGEKVSSENISTDTERRTAIQAYNWMNMSGINRIMNYEPYTYFDITDCDDDFIFNKNYSAEKGKVITSSTNLNLRAKPTTNSGIITEMSNNSEINIYGHNDSWAYISYESNGKIYYGYASMSYIESASLTTTTTTTNTTTTTTTTTTASDITSYNSHGIVNAGLNLRSAPDLNANIILVMPVNSSVTITGYNDEWYKVTYQSGGKTYNGYASRDYITDTAEIDWQSAYKKTLSSLAGEYDFTESDIIIRAMYDLVDIDGNGIPELIISTGNAHASGCVVYTYTNSGYVKTTFSDGKEGFSEYGYMGVDTTNHVARSYYSGMGCIYLDFYRLEGTTFVNIASFFNDEGNNGSDYRYNDNSVTKSQYQSYLSQYNYTFEKYGRKYYN